MSIERVAEPDSAADNGPDAGELIGRFKSLLVGAGQRIALVAVIAILIIAFSNIVDIVLRNLFARSLYALNEINALLVAIAVSCCLGYGIVRGAALTITFMVERFSLRAQAWCMALAATLSSVFFVLLAWRVGAAAALMERTGQTTMIADLPTAPFFYAVAVAIGFAALIQVVLAVVALRHAIRMAGASGLLIAGVMLAVILHMALAMAGFVPGGFYMVVVPDNGLVLALLSFAVMWGLILLGVPLGTAMGLIGIAGTVALIGPDPSMDVLGSEVTGFVTRDALSVLPLFLLMGAFATVAGIGSDLYRVAWVLLGHFRGGLAHASILACAGFGTLTGSSVATQMSIGKIAIKEMQDRNYSPALAAGSIAAGGTLGQLVPPSSALILYAVMTEQSVGRLFMGAFVPGILAMLLYMATVVVWLIFHPDDGRGGKWQGFRELALAARGAWSVLLLLGVVLGGIYLGFFTELEAGSVGAAGAFLIALARGRINRITFWETMGETTRTLAMMYSLIFGVTMLSFFFGISGVPQAFISFINGLGLPPMGVITALVLCYLLLGTAMDEFAMMVITIPIFAPLVVSLGFDPVWWGVMTLVCMGAGMISPPFGINIFVISALDKRIPLTTVFRGCWPFFGSTLVKIALMMLFPALVTWLPSTM